MAYPAPVFEQEPEELRGRFYAWAQVINTSFAEGDATKMRSQIGMCQRARLRCIRDNELDTGVDFQANLAAAQARSVTKRAHIAQEVTELSNAGIWFMPTMGHWLWGLDQDATVRAAMPGAYPMQGAASLYNSLSLGTGVGWTATSKQSVRSFLVNLAVFGDGGTYAGPAGAKPGPNRTTALGLGGDALIDAIWAFIVSDTIAFLTTIGYGQAGKKIWLQWMNGPENSESLTLEHFWDSGYFGNASVVGDLKQSVTNAVSDLCGIHSPRFGYGANQEASAAARDTLYHQRMAWAVQRIMAAIEAAFPTADNTVCLYQSMHEYNRKNQERFAGKFDSEIIDEANHHRLYDDPRDVANAHRDPSYLSSDFDQDKRWYLRAKKDVSMVLSIDGGQTTVTVAANANAATLRTALRTLAGFGDGDDPSGFDDITVVLQQGPGGNATNLRDIGTQYETPGGYETYGYMVSMGSYTGYPAAGVGPASDSKSKLKPCPFELTSHNATPNDCLILTWSDGGNADRGPGLKNWIKRKTSLGVRSICLHAPIHSGGYDDAIWVYGPSTTPGTWEYYRVNSVPVKARLANVAGPMMEDEPFYHQWFWHEFGKYMESLNP